MAEITYLTWTSDNLLRHTVYVGLREDKPAEQVRRDADAPELALQKLSLVRFGLFPFHGDRERSSAVPEGGNASSSR